MAVSGVTRPLGERGQTRRHSQDHCRTCLAIGRCKHRHARETTDETTDETSDKAGDHGDEHEPPERRPEVAVAQAPRTLQGRDRSDFLEYRDDGAEASLMVTKYVATKIG